MFISTQQTDQANIKGSRDTTTPRCIWLRLNHNATVCFELHDAQKVVAELTRELQAEAAYQASLGVQS